jgi:hypothetical protein
MRLMIIHYVMTVKGKGMLAVNVRKVRALTVKLSITDNAGEQSDSGKGR